MITKEKILEILDKYAKDNFGINNTYIDNLEFEDLAEELVKNCSIPYVVGRSEQLVCSCGSRLVKTTGGYHCGNARCSV